MGWIKSHIHPDAEHWRKLWSIQLALFWAAFSGLWVAWPAFQSFMPPLYFAGSCIAFSLVICVARLTNQPGLN